MNQDIIDKDDGRLVYSIADAANLVAIAVAAEREACAKICDEGPSFDGELIRARSLK